MTTESLAVAFQPLLLRLFDFLADHPEIRTEVGRAAKALATWSEADASPERPTLPIVVSKSSEPSVVVEPIPARPEPVVVKAVPIPADFRIPIRSTLDDEPQIAAVRPLSEYEPAQGSPAEIAARCRLKAETTRLLTDGQANLSYESRGELMRQANELRQCRLWMLELGAKPPTAWRNLAAAYEAAAAAAEMIAGWNNQAEAEHERKASDVLHLAAEAQAVLYAAVESIGADRPDYDQIAVFKIIRDEGDRARVFIKRYLTRSDKADPANGPDVKRRIAELTGVLKKPVADPEKEVTKLLKNLRFKLKPLDADPSGATVEWPRVYAVIGDLMEQHRVPPSHIELREILMPVLSVAPTDDVPNAADRALREARRHLEELNEPIDEPIERASYSAEVSEVRSMLSGKIVVFIGGQARRYAKSALEDAFDLEECNWICTPDHTSTSVFEAPIARANVAVVLLATRWSNHDYQNVKAFCINYGKLFVKLPTGYHPNQVASEILDQIGDKLRAGR